MYECLMDFLYSVLRCMSGDIHCRIVDSSYGMFTNWSGLFDGSPCYLCSYLPCHSTVDKSLNLKPTLFITWRYICISTTQIDGLAPISPAVLRLINSRRDLTRICQRFGFLHASTPLSLPKSPTALGFGSSIVPTVVQVAISLSSQSQCLSRPLAVDKTTQPTMV